VAAVHDDTLGQVYFESNSLERVVFEKPELNPDITIGGFVGSASDCSLENGSGCLMTLTGSIRNVQRIVHNYTIVIQTKDSAGIVVGIEIFPGYALY